MKKHLLFTFIFILAFTAVDEIMAQTPEMFKYQAVLRDAGGNIVPSTPVTVVIDILQGGSSGTSVYSETHSITTTAQGVINLNIGGGSVVSGSFALINWSNNTYWTKVSVNGTEISNGQLLSVPYSLNVKGINLNPVNGFIGIGTMNPTCQLDVNGAINSTSATVNGVPVATTATTYWNGGAGSTINYTAGNVGIGTTNPTYTLDVNGVIHSTIDGGECFRVGNDMTLQDINISNHIGLYGAQDATIGTIKLGSGGGTISGKDGNIGIGTTSPIMPLHITSSAFASGLIVKSTGGSAISLDGSNPGINFNEYNNGSLKVAVDNNYSGNINLNPTDGLFSFRTGNNPGTGNTVTETARMVILNNGDIGIGTTAPTSKVHVVGSDERTNLVVESNSATFGPELRLYSTATGGHEWRIVSGSASNPYGAGSFELWDQTESASRFGITATGNVGIGITTPTYKLDVNGVIHSTIDGGECFRVGNDMTLQDINVSNYIGLYGAQDATIGTIKLGSGGGTISGKDGNIGIGTATPAATLDVAGTVRIADGTQGANKVLTSDASGNASWVTNTGVTAAVIAVRSGTSYNWTSAAPVYTGTTLTLPPGKWSVQICMLIPKDNDASAALWVRSTLTDGSGISSPTGDIIGASLASGYKASSAWGLVQGTIIINNTSGSDKTYYYWGQGCEIYSGTFDLKDFGTSLWLENQIIAYPMN